MAIPRKSQIVLVRFEHLTEAIRSGGGLEAFAYREPPESMTRMLAVRDTSCQERDSSRFSWTRALQLSLAQRLTRVAWSPRIIINFGNGHTVAALLDEGRITAIFEHHTSRLRPEKLRDFAEKLCDGTLKNSEVFEDGGHGAYIDSVPGGSGRCSSPDHAGRSF